MPTTRISTQHCSGLASRRGQASRCPLAPIHIHESIKPHKILRKVIDFYAVELADADFDGVDDGSHDDLGTLQFIQDFIFQTAQGNIAANTKKQARTRNEPAFYLFRYCPPVYPLRPRT